MKRQGLLERLSIRLLMPRQASQGIFRAMPFILLAALLDRPAEYVLFYNIGNLSNWLSPGVYYALLGVCRDTSLCAWAIGLTLLMIAVCRLISPGCQNAIW